MKIVVTGSEGFIGKNLIQRLWRMDGVTVCPFDIDTDPGLLAGYVKDCDVLYHLAGINRPEKEEEYMEGNFGFTKTILGLLDEADNTKAKIVMSSSIQAELDNPYGVSKKAGEDLIRERAAKTYMYVKV